MTVNQGSATVAEVLVDYLARAGVTDVFGVAGSTIMPILDALEGDGRIRYWGARYEQSAADMASGYARASGRLGVVMTHVGPGVTSAVTAVVGAARDGVPLLFITGNEESETLPRQPYHDWELLRVMGVLTDFSHRVTRPEDLPHVVRRAIGQATRVNPQPVHIDLPEDVGLRLVSDEEVQTWLGHVEPTLRALKVSGTAPISRPHPSQGEVSAAADLVEAAQRPVLVLGEAVRHPTRSAVIQLCRDMGIPFATTHGGRGGDDQEPLYLGTIGRFGNTDTTVFVGEADLVVALGAELSDIDTVRWRVPAVTTRKILVHPNGGRIDTRYSPDLGVVADVEQFLAAIRWELAQRGYAVDGDWAARARVPRPPAGSSPDGAPENPEASSLDHLLVTSAIDALPDTWALSSDPGFGALTLTAASRPRVTPFLYPFGFGYMGFAVPNAIGAVHSGVVDGALAVIGDGAFFMSLSSLESVASLRAPVAVIVLDDGGFGSQRKKQAEGYGRNVGVDYDNPDIAKIGAAMGIESRWIDSAADVEEFCRALPGRKEGILAVVRRSKVQQQSWYEGSAKRR